MFYVKVKESKAREEDEYIIIPYCESLSAIRFCLRSHTEKVTNPVYHTFGFRFPPAVTHLLCATPTSYHLGIKLLLSAALFHILLS